MSSTFRSHNHHDKAFVHRLGGDLKAAGIRVRIDEAKILVGDSLIAKVEAGIDYRSAHFRVRRDLTLLQQ